MAPAPMDLDPPEPSKSGLSPLDRSVQFAHPRCVGGTVSLVRAVDGILVVKADELVLEQYFDGYRLDYDDPRFRGERISYDLETRHNLMNRYSTASPNTHTFPMKPRPRSPSNISSR